MTETATNVPEPKPLPRAPKGNPFQPYKSFLYSFFEIVVFCTILFVCLLAFFGLLGQAIFSTQEFFTVVRT